MDNCIFCKIVKKDIPAEVVFENDDFLAFLDINPVSEGHTLLIPKEHFPSLEKTPDEVVEKIFVIAKKMMPGIKKAMKADFVVLTIVGIDVPHLHIHLIPRYENDGLANFWPVKKYESDSQKEDVKNKISQELKDIII